ncbi:AAA family ATPase [Lysinibacillus sp. FSL M8-0216]|uniref:AAA family ATPase n=1 Tax=Lysinibacillus sp. FSL M8-0216 TaxID=2921619 RepID=UPI00315A6227
MLFKVLNNLSEIEPDSEEVVHLIQDDWNDWWEFKTLYQVYIGNNYIGSVKIGSNILKEKRPNLPETFTELDKDFYSLGQSEDYYMELNKLGATRVVFLRALKDIAYDKEHYQKVRRKQIVVNSLMRDISSVSVQGRLRKLANGDATLTKFYFTYMFKDESIGEIDFEVNPRSYPPSNMHVLIGRNGIGKSFFLNKMLDSLVKGDKEYGEFINLKGKRNLFSKVVSVSFSAFDDYIPIEDSKIINYTYLGLKQLKKEKAKKIDLPPKSPKKLTTEFAQSIFKCSIEGKMDLWQELVKELQYDPAFDQPEIKNVLSFENLNLDEQEIKKKAMDAFKNLSSGHKIVLLTLARLIENVEEKTIVIMDEPETYLHPPLVSAFIQVISTLLRKRNGVAIIVTHSPVILQEIPRKCVWKIRKEGVQYSFNRPKIETFGENLGVLTREIFGLEVSETGFHKLIKQAVLELGDYSSVLEHFNNELGDEAKNLVMALADDEGDF